jgi:hypothetical protein
MPERNVLRMRRSKRALLFYLTGLHAGPVLFGHLPELRRAQRTLLRRQYVHLRPVHQRDVSAMRPGRRAMLPDRPHLHLQHVLRRRLRDDLQLRRAIR